MMVYTVMTGVHVMNVWLEMDKQGEAHMFALHGKVRQNMECQMYGIINLLILKFFAMDVQIQKKKILQLHQV